MHTLCSTGQDTIVCIYQNQNYSDCVWVGVDG